MGGALDAVELVVNKMPQPDVNLTLLLQTHRVDCAMVELTLG